MLYSVNSVDLDFQPNDEELSFDLFPEQKWTRAGSNVPYVTDNDYKRVLSMIEGTIGDENVMLSRQ